MRLRRPRSSRLLAVGMVVLLAVGVASCAGEDQIGSPSHRMREWVTGTTLGEDIGTLTADNARIPKTVPNGTGAVHAACGALEDDAEQFKVSDKTARLGLHHPVGLPYAPCRPDLILTMSIGC